MSEWVYVIRPTRTSFAERPTEQESATMSEHFQYLKALLDDGALVMAGPALDAAFGLVVFEAGDENEVRAIMEGDPSVARGVMSASLHPYRTSLLRGRG